MVPNLKTFPRQKDYKNEKRTGPYKTALEPLMNKMKLNSVALSPQAKYSDRVTAPLTDE
jgi:hypothetical protein